MPKTVFFIPVLAIYLIFFSGDGVIYGQIIRTIDLFRALVVVQPAFAVEIPIAKDDEPQVNKEVGQELSQEFRQVVHQVVTKYSLSSDQVVEQEFRQVTVQVKELVLCMFGHRLPKSGLLKLGNLTKSRETLV